MIRQVGGAKIWKRGIQVELALEWMSPGASLPGCCGVLSCSHGCCIPCRAHAAVPLPGAPHRAQPLPPATCLLLPLGLSLRPCHCPCPPEDPTSPACYLPPAPKTLAALAGAAGAAGMPHRWQMCALLARARADAAQRTLLAAATPVCTGCKGGAQWCTQPALRTQG